MPFVHGRLVVSLLVLGVAGCPSPNTVNLPVHEEAASVLVLNEEETGVVVAFANDLGPTASPLYVEGIQDPVRFTAVFLDLALADLGLTRGPIPSAPIGRSLDTLPVTEVFQTTTIELVAWDRVTPRDSDAFVHFRVPLFPAEDCAESGGCHEGDQTQCIIPCPASPSIAEPGFTDEPSPPEWAPCSTGWREATHTTEGLIGPPHMIHLCEPIAPDEECPAGSQAFVGDVACARFGSACAGWPTDLDPGTPTIFVRPMATGNGERNNPLGTIAEALAVVPQDGVIALAPGTYAETVILDRGIHLAGTCADTRLEGAPDTPIVLVRGVGGRLTNLSLHTTGAAIEVNGATITVEDVAIVADPMPATAHAAVELTNGALLANDLVIEGGARHGIQATASQVQIDRIILRRLSGTGVRLAGASTATITGLLLEQTEYGLFLEDSAMHVERSYFAEQRASACHFARSSVAMDTIVIRDSAETGIEMWDTTLTGQRVAIERSVGIGVITTDGTIDVSDFILLDTRQPSDHAYGLFASGGETTLRRSVLAGNGGDSIWLDGGHTQLENMMILDTRMVGNRARGIDARPDAQLEGRFLLIESQEGEALWSTGQEALFGLQLYDVRIAHSGGRSVELREGSHTLERVRIEAGDHIGVSVGSEASSCQLRARDLVVRDQSGLGLQVLRWSGLDAARFRIQNNDGVGLSIGTETELTITDGEILDNGSGGAIVPREFDAAQLLNLVRFGPGQAIHRSN